jgi:bifunctional UDP-N-acetylglucosamine pyrophosphorylase/glucosamine-1-phosphate N-acetyltransferase
MRSGKFMHATQPRENLVSAGTPSAIIVLAAGQGTRMKSTLPKVMHPICGRPLLGHVLAAVDGLEPDRLAVVVGHRRELVDEYLATDWPDAISVLQAEQNGTGHAVRVALAGLAESTIGAPQDGDGPVIVVAGDTPLLTTETLAGLVHAFEASDLAAAVLTAELDDPTGYGRIVRDDAGHVTAIVEHRDADAPTLAVREINSGVYAFAPAALISALARITTDNSQGEEYLTDAVALLVADGKNVAAHVVANPDEVNGINDRVQLAQARRLLNDRVLDGLMRSGVTVVDPATTWVDVQVAVEPDAVLLQGTRLEGETQIGSGARIGPDTTLVDTTVDVDARVRNTTADSAYIGAGAEVGPYTFLRPGTVLKAKSKAGGFVEIKNSVVGEGSKVPHLSYVGDAEIGEKSNIGAATVFVNYDGVAKHRTVIGNHVRIGSDTMLVAPVEVADGAYTAAGSVITEDVPPGALAIARGKQRNVERWVDRARPGSPAATAAAAARESAQAEEGTE